jgi:hypothetical protein
MSKTTREIQNKIKENKSLALYDFDELEYLEIPIGKALYKHQKNDTIEEQDEITKIPRGRPRKNPDKLADPNDKIICDICGKTYTRSNKTAHVRTQRHKIYTSVNEKLRKLLIDNQ